MKQHCTILLVLAALVFIGGCSNLNSTSAAKDISIIIPIRLDQFSKQAVLHVNLLNAAQIAIEDANPICTVMGGGVSGVVSTTCPPGTEYKKVTPEEFSFPVGEVSDQIRVTSSTLKLGEKFQITVYGQNVDQCNSTSTRYTGVATAETISLKDLLWATTQMACLKTP